ncbi:MAG: hypothetical protein MUO77_06805 [Anaerolineales bacterium]|nr:hypothetical protein [Anaerolineales bacterium]
MITQGRPSLFQTWWLAIRLRTLPAAASGVVMGSAPAWADGVYQAGRPLNAALAGTGQTVFAYSLFLGGDFGFVVAWFGDFFSLFISA